MNRYTNLTPSDFNPLSLQEQMMIPLAKQKKHDALLNDTVKSGIFDVNRLQVDDELINQNITTLKDRFKGIEDELLEKGVSSGLSKKLLELRRDKEAFLSNDGIGGKAQNAYKGYQANEKAIRSNRNIKAQDADRYLNYAAQRYSNSGGVGADQSYNAYHGANSVGLATKASTFGKELRPQDITRILRNQGIVRNTKELTPEDGYKAIVYSMMTDNETMDYVNALSESTGQSQMSILEGAAKSAAIRVQRNDQHDKPLAGKTIVKNEDSKKTTPKEGLVALEGDVTTLKRRFGNMNNLRRLAKDPNHPQNAYAKRALEHMTAEAMKNPKNTELLSKVKEELSGLPNEFSQTGNIIEWAKASQAGMIGKSEGKEIDGKYYITSIDNNNSNVDIFEVDAQVYDEYKKGIYGNIVHENLSQQQKRGSLQGRTAVKSKTSMHNVDTMKPVDEYFNKTGSPSAKFTFENLKSTDRKFITDNVFNLAISGGIDNFEVINMFSGDEGEGVNYDEENTIKRKKELFDVLKSGNITDKKVSHVQYDNYSGLPVVRISFMKNSADGKTNKYHEMDIAVDKLSHRTGVKSGEYALLNSLKQFGGKQGEVIHDYMTKSIKYKDVIENYDMDDFDNSSSIKKALPERLFGKNSMFNKTDQLNIYNNEGSFQMMIKGEDGSNAPMKWKDIITSDRLSELNPKSNPDFYKAIIKQAIDNGFVDARLEEVVTDGKFDGNKMDKVIKTMIDFDEVVSTKDKIVLMNILNSKR